MRNASLRVAGNELEFKSDPDSGDGSIYYYLGTLASDEGVSIPSNLPAKEGALAIGDLDLGDVERPEWAENQP